MWARLFFSGALGALIVFVGSAFLMQRQQEEPQGESSGRRTSGGNGSASSLRDLQGADSVRRRKKAGASSPPSSSSGGGQQQQEGPQEGGQQREPHFWESFASATYERDSCMLCMARPADSGFLHGNSVHVCCCQECALQYRQSSAGRDKCPICRQTIDRVVRAH